MSADDPRFKCAPMPIQLSNDPHPHLNSEWLRGEVWVNRELEKLRAENDRLRMLAKAVIELEWGDPAKGCKVGGGAAWKALADAVGSRSESDGGPK